MQKYESYQTRRVPLRLTGATRGAIAKARIDGLRDLMRMEMPDRFADFLETFDKDPITVDPRNQVFYSKALGLTNVATNLAAPAVTKNYMLRYFNLKANQTKAVGSQSFESAECLYMIIAYGLQDQEALERFSESEIGDVDSDGLPEFIDAWGKPIAFMRCAPMFPSDVQFPNDSVNIPNLRASYPPSSNDLQKLAQFHHDPFDPLRQDPNAFACYPLIYSAGPDRIFDVDSGSRAAPNSPFSLPLESGMTKDLDSEFGSADTVENWHDNITNHDLLVP